MDQVGNSDEVTTPLIDEKTSREETQTYSDDDVHMSQSNSEADLNDSLSRQRKISPLEIQTYSISPSNTYLHMKSLASPTGEELTEGLLSRDNSVASMDEEILELQCKDEGAIDERNTYSYAKFLKAHSCYDFIPNSSKIVVFDTKLKVKKAFFALVHNNIRSAPVWDSTRCEFVDMSTKKLPPYLIRISPKERNIFVLSLSTTSFADLSGTVLYTAVEMLVKNRIHRLPVIDSSTGNALYILTHKKILRYIFQHLDDLAMPDFMGYTLKQLGIGSYENIATINPWTRLIEALHIFNARGVSALPIVDEHNKCVDLYSKFDVINLAAERTYNNLDKTVQEALSHRQTAFEGVRKCNPSESLYTIIERIYINQVHRLVVVDEHDKILGIISLSDILRFLVIDPPKLNIHQ